jgi:CDGSH-type Zn-finger protein
MAQAKGMTRPDIVEQDGGGAEPSYVVAGAILSCSCGTQLNRLKTPYCHGVHLKEKAQLNVEDRMPMIHIMPFGNCTSRLNPSVLTGQFDIEGVQKAPCIPVITTPWIDGKTDVLVEGQPALLSTCVNQCIHGGRIVIEDDGQELGGSTLEGTSGFGGAIR